MKNYLLLTFRVHESIAEAESYEIFMELSNETNLINNSITY